MKILKRFMAMLLVLCMVISVVPMNTYAEETNATESTKFDRILHLDCGRKYFTKDWIIALINEMAAAGYNQLQLAFGNDGLRFLLNNMSFEANGISYEHSTVVSKVEAGNKAQNNSNDSRWLTQAEMDSIVAHADSKGIEIVPLLNLPGHANAILDIVDDSYNASGSNNTLNVATSEEAQNFGLAIFKKYVDYFAEKGCKYFNFGADEYANDASGAFSFSRLNSTEYGEFIEFIGEMNTYIEGKRMIARAFNDGFYYNGQEADIDTDIQCCYWSCGWLPDYPVASAKTIADKGHKMINTHGDYYFILKDGTIQNPVESAGNFKNTEFMNSTISDPVGSMFCIWCDVPSIATEQEVAAAVRITLRKIAAAMKGTSDYSTDVVSGGFNEDGSIAETRKWKVVTANENDAIKVGGYELTRATAKELTGTDIPEVEGAKEVKAWDITPYVNDTKYTDIGTVSIPVPAGWTDVRGGVVATEGGPAASGIVGELKDGMFTFDVLHFSTVYAYERDADAIVADETIELEVGGTEERVIKDVDYRNKFTISQDGIADVEVEYEQGEGDQTTTTVTNPINKNAYYLKNSEGKYLSENLMWVDNVGDAVPWTATSSDGVWYIFSYDGAYLLYNPYEGVLGTSTNMYHGYMEYFWLNKGSLSGDYSKLEVTAETVSGTVAVNQSTITITGIAPGETYVTLGEGEITYKIIVTGKVEITINYKVADGTIVKSDKVQVASNATTYTLSDFNAGDKFYTIENKTLNITPSTVTEYNVTVTETEEDLSTVESLVVEYWQTNARVVTEENGEISSKEFKASDAYSEEGLSIGKNVPRNAYKKDSVQEVVYWRARLLEGDVEQTEENADDETLNGIGFTKIRYWNGSWAVYTDDGEWKDIEPSKCQLVAYYLMNMNLANEVIVGTSDWGKKVGDEYAKEYLGPDHVSLAFQVVFEGGNTSPATTTAADLAEKCYLVDRFSGGRGVGSIVIAKLADYQIWKVTAETGHHETTYTNQESAVNITSFKWDDNEKTLWEGESTDLFQFVNPTSNPSTEGAYENLTWDERNESILIRIYVQAEKVQPEEQEKDSLKVVYYDERFDRELSSFNIIVNKGVTFEKLDPTYKEFQGPVPNRIDVTGCSIKDAYDNNREIQTNLANIAINIDGKYQKDLYIYNGSVIDDDNKTLYLYYTLKTIAPSYVADFGLPIKFKLTDIVDENYVNSVDTVQVTEETAYGSLTYNSERQEFTYTPTKILQSVNELPISIKFKDETKATVINAGVYPATTVYYEESFLKWDEKVWTLVTDATKTLLQECEKLDEHTYNFGYDDVYEENIGASNGTSRRSATIGATGEFDFTGTGIQVFANCTEGSGYVAVQVKDSNGKLVKLAMVDTVVDGGETSATNGQTGNMYGLPIVSLIDLQNMPHGTYNVKVIKIMDTEPVSIDGIRVFNTIADSTIFEKDLEDNPEFYELRDYVLHAIEVSDTTSKDYGTLAEMAKQVYAGISTDAEAPSAIITDKNIANIYGSGATAQDLLDNGPKNELYLYKDQTLTFKVKTDRIMQLGLKTPKGETKYTINVTSGDKTINTIGTDTNPKSIASSVDMFYSLGNERGEQKEYTIEVTNKGKEATSRGLNDILSITLLKICDDPNAGFVSLTEKDMEHTLATMGYTFPEEENKVPESTVKPEDTTKPESTAKPGSSTTTEGTKSEAEDTKDSLSSSLPTEIVKVEVADSTKEPSKVDQKETVSTSTDVKEETTESEETVVESEITVEEDVELETETDIQESEISETTESEESNGNLIVMIGSAAAILAAVIALIFGFKKSKKR